MPKPPFVALRGISVRFRFFEVIRVGLIREGGEAYERREEKMVSAHMRMAEKPRGTPVGGEWKEGQSDHIRMCSRDGRPTMPKNEAPRVYRVPFAATQR